MNFVYSDQNVLNNLLYILSSIFVYYFIYDNGELFKKHKKLLMIICTSLPLILCMKFPIYIDLERIHDLRQIPFLIGTLYGGPLIGIVLLGIMLLFRVIFYGVNFLIVIVYITMLIVAAFSSSKFKNLNRRKKLIMSMLLTVFLGLLTTVIIVILADFQINTSYIIDFILLPPIVMLFVVYIIEILNDAIMMRSKLVKVEKMEIVSQLAASISHEVKNPLTVVKGFTQLLKTPDLSQESRELYIKHIIEELNHAQAIIDDYLTFAKPASQKIDTIVIDQELRRVMSMMMPLCNMNSVNISENLVTGSITGNTQHFHQCFLNLIKNSIEAMPTGGILNISSSISENKIIIMIKDSGIGMTKDQINRFGEPYFSTKSKGTGLGTMVAVKIIETMNGTLNIKSVVSKGTTLTVTFQRSNEQA
ncbi:HAMP domain-containing sensor histidine kinase [Bacillus sp. DX4.1]|uniref:sensor histidine kinase n=1 Tax=Bacillus sp. DX4.1 TaxID=3055867 RepID=UPI0025A22C58|nr:HAMP domain-containing sensor histidine kinase [Bacillus sp. DX4.1]MDM5188862.1 HAMP domain-containing sensor histidine kinase [Bacillus sp. DX4.1]